MNDTFQKLDEKARKYRASVFGLSTTKNKRFYVIYDNRIINFGSKVGQT
jgi:hypothetical protein